MGDYRLSTAPWHHDAWVLAQGDPKSIVRQRSNRGVTLRIQPNSNYAPRGVLPVPISIGPAGLTRTCAMIAQQPQIRVANLGPPMPRLCARFLTVVDDTPGKVRRDLVNLAPGNPLFSGFVIYVNQPVQVHDACLAYSPSFVFVCVNASRPSCLRSLSPNSYKLRKNAYDVWSGFGAQLAVRILPVISGDLVRVCLGEFCSLDALVP